MTDSRDNWLTFGYNTGVVRDLRAAWGARWIVTQDGGVDQLYDRQSAFGDQDRVEKLFQWLDSGANKRAREIASRMLSEYKISTSEAWPVILHQDSQGAIVGNTNGSAGYMHVAAYRYEDLPEGLKSRGLEMVLSHNYKPSARTASWCAAPSASRTNASTRTARRHFAPGASTSPRARSLLRAGGEVRTF